MRGRRVAFCALRRQRADLDEAEPRGEERRRNARILIEARGHAERISKFESPYRLRQPWVVWRGGAGIKSELEALDRKVMRPLWIERVQQRLAKAVKRFHAAIPSGRRWRPFSCSDKASTEIT